MRDERHRSLRGASAAAATPVNRRALLRLEPHHCVPALAAMRDQPAQQQAACLKCRVGAASPQWRRRRSDGRQPDAEEAPTAEESRSELPFDELDELDEVDGVDVVSEPLAGLDGLSEGFDFDSPSDLLSLR
ncbi:hypothetical protein [Candidatus Poriferisodalis sp.]|uniref:hypothetical protein n=1 Tax=Candidatus Poriferisodalis sp. TaxID=3101277 RepID=UPI003D14818E